MRDKTTHWMVRKRDGAVEESYGPTYASALRRAETKNTRRCEALIRDAQKFLSRKRASVKP